MAHDGYVTMMMMMMMISSELGNSQCCYNNISICDCCHYDANIIVVITDSIVCVCIVLQHYQTTLVSHTQCRHLLALH